MSTGLVLQGPDGKTIQVPFDQAANYGIAPQVVQKWIQGIAQPQAGLQQTQTSTAQTAAAIPGTQANSQVEQAKAGQLKILQNAGGVFSKNVDKQGYVAPNVYNAQKASFVASGGDSATFDNTYADNYVSPNNAMYNTPDAKQAQGVLPIIKQLVQGYSNLPSKGPLLGSIADIAQKIPFLGNYLRQQVASKDDAYNQFMMGQAGQIKNIAGATSGQGFRFNLQELNNIVGMLPDAYDSTTKANAKLDNLNTFMTNKMGVSLDSLLGGGSQ